MRFRLLGPVEVVVDGRRLPVDRPRQRGVLAYLLLHANRLVTTDELVEALWRGAAPATARTQIQTDLSIIRRVLREAGHDPITSRPFGYVVRVDPGQLDVEEFTRCAARAAALAGDAVGAVAGYREALGLWRGPALADVSGVYAEAVRAGLDERRLRVYEELFDLELASGRHETVIVEVGALLATHPLHERFATQLMLALYRDGRPAEAMTVARELRTALADEHGIEPGPELRDMERAVLGDDPVLRLSRPALPLPAQLPPDVGGFVGREAHLADLDVALRGVDVALAIISGTAGVGKTALAVRWAHRVRDSFPDGQLYIDLRGFAPTRPVRPIEALTRFLRALAVPHAQIPVDVDEASALYRSVLVDHRMLVVLDNAADANQVRPLLPGGSHCRVLVTSRRELAGLVARNGAHRLDLSVLDERESRELLTRRLGDGDRAQFDELANLCARLPLALHIAAANLDRRSYGSIAEYAKELADHDRLSALAIDGDPDSAVRSALDLSYVKLPPLARRLFRLMGVVPGPHVTPTSASVLLGVPARAPLGQLADAHLLDRGVGDLTGLRFTAHDLIRDYARDLAVTDDPDRFDTRGALGRLYDHYLATATAAAELIDPGKLRLESPGCPPQPPPFTDSEGALAWLDAEQANLVAAVLRAPVDGHRPVAWYLADRLRGYDRRRIREADWEAVATAALDAARDDDDPCGQASACSSLGLLSVRFGDYARALEHYELGLVQARRAGWETAQSSLTINLGAVHSVMGRPAAAAEYAERALAIAGSDSQRASALNNLGLASTHLGRSELAIGYFRQAIDVYRRAGARTGEAIGTANLAVQYHEIGRPEEAIHLLHEALALAHPTDDRPLRSMVHAVMAEIHGDASRHPEALESATVALALARDPRDRRSEAVALHQLARATALTKDHAQAESLYRQSLRISREGQEGLPELDALIGLATVTQDRDAATSLAEEALALARQRGYPVREDRARKLVDQLRRGRT